MKVLVAKRPSPPRQEGDVWSAMHNEIVVAPFVCQEDCCECDHVHQGIVSHGYSTEVQVREITASLEALVAACRSHLGFSQWAAVVEHPSGLEMLAADLIDDMSLIAKRYPAETVLHVTFDHQASQWRYTAT